MSHGWSRSTGGSTVSFRAEAFDTSSKRDAICAAAISMSAERYTSRSLIDAAAASVLYWRTAASARVSGCALEDVTKRIARAFTIGICAASSLAMADAAATDASWSCTAPSETTRILVGRPGVSSETRSGKTPRICVEPCDGGEKLRSPDAPCTLCTITPHENRIRRISSWSGTPRRSSMRGNTSFISVADQRPIDAELSMIRHHCGWAIGARSS
mmetsp:Transcript_36508/g.116998  ORF Transcript_36508/g.116998 Transcript_36508/m.116998 type:complete len:215 (-) Transcript_36508:173-817(-)